MTENQANNQKSSLRQWLPGILVSAVIIGILLYVVDLKQLAASFRNVSFRLIAIVFVLQSVAFIFRGLAWRVILDNQPTLIQCFWTITEGYLLNLLPLRLGEIGRAVIMGGLINRSPVFVFSTVLLERLFDVIVTLIILLGTIPLVNGANFSTTTYSILMAVIVIGLICVFLIIRNQEKFLRWLEKIIKPETKFGRFALPQIRSLMYGMTILADPKKFIIWLFWILMTWVCWLATVNIAMKAFFPALPSWASLFVQSVTALGGAIPSAPAGIGVIEGAFVAALRFFQIEQSAALGFGMFIHALGIITPVFWGILGFTIQGQRFSDIFQRLRKVDLSKEGEKDA